MNIATLRWMGVPEAELRMVKGTYEKTNGSVWRKVEGLMGDKHISQKLKGKVLSSCITPAYLYSLETMVMT